MKEFKGTPGPWHASNEGTLVVRDDIFFSHVASNIGYPSDNEDMANANIIAASPDLLTALQSLVEIYDNDGSRFYTTETKQRALDKAKVAIDKALGETK